MGKYISKYTGEEIDAILDKAAKVAQRPIIVGRAVPRKALPGNRYFFSDGNLVIKTLQGGPDGQNPNAFKWEISRIKMTDGYPIIITIPEGWEGIVDEYLEASDRALFIPFIKEFKGSAETASPLVKIIDGKLVYMAYPTRNIIPTYNTDIKKCTRQDLCDIQNRYMNKYEITKYRSRYTKPYLDTKIVRFRKWRQLCMVHSLGLKPSSSGQYVARLRIRKIWRKRKKSALYREYVCGWYVKADHTGYINYIREV